MESESSMDVGETSLDQTGPPLVPDPDSSLSFVPSERDEAAVEVHDTVVDAQSAVLANDDLLSLIFSFHSINIFDPSDAPTSLASLLQASLTCKTFFHPAIRALWQSMNSIVPLLKLISGVVEKNGLLTMTKVISEEDLLRFDFYAQFVRRFELSAKSLQYLTKEGIFVGNIFLLVHDHRPRGLLPALQLMEIGQPKRLVLEDVWLLRMLVPSAGTLSKLIIRNIVDVEEEILAASILKSIYMKSPRLALIALGLGGCQDWAIFDVLQDIKSLQTIYLSLNFASFPLSRRIQGSMANLVTLQLRGDIKAVHWVIGAVFHETPQLKNLKISLRARADLNFISSNLVDEITSRTDIYLDSLMIDLDYFMKELDFTSSLQHFDRPCCQNLKRLSIPIFDLSSATFAKLFRHASSYRSLVLLDISGTSGIASILYNFKTSLATLELIRNKVPNLRCLYIPIFLNTDDGESFQFTDGTNTCHGLQELRLKPFQIESDSGRQRSGTKYKYSEFYFPSKEITDLLLIARCFDHLFPHLRKFDTRELRGFVKERWLDGLDAAVKHFGEQRRRWDWNCEVCEK